MPDNTAADHINVLRDALRQLPDHRTGTRPGRRILIRADSAGCTHELLNWIVTQRLSYSVGFTLPDTLVGELARVPARGWQPAAPSPRPDEQRPAVPTTTATGPWNRRTRATSGAFSYPTGRITPRRPAMTGHNQQ